MPGYLCMVLYNGLVPDMRVLCSPSLVQILALKGLLHFDDTEQSKLMIDSGTNPLVCNPGAQDIKPWSQATVS